MRVAALKRLQMGIGVSPCAMDASADIDAKKGYKKPVKEGLACRNQK